MHTSRITSDYRIMLGKPIVSGTRITVELLLRKMGQGATPTDLVVMYPHLTQDDIQAVLNYAADVLANQELMEASA